ncbi:unnamed protein product [Durusdinium trenchii]|uniref:Uncharacterized protein n=1 Tax=Durusdinium trenchii TaxID=1381693 RepID=A0ABP0ND81_9DINO
MPDPPSEAGAEARTSEETSKEEKADPEATPAGKKRPQNKPNKQSADAKRAKIAKGVAIAAGDRGVYFTTMHSGGVDKAKRELQQLLENYKVSEASEAEGSEVKDSSKIVFTPCSEATKGMGFFEDDEWSSNPFRGGESSSGNAEGKLSEHRSAESGGVVRCCRVKSSNLQA